MSYFLMKEFKGIEALKDGKGPLRAWCWPGVLVYLAVHLCTVSDRHRFRAVTWIVSLTPLPTQLP